MFNLMAHSKMPKRSGSHGLVTESLPDVVVPCPPDQLPLPVLVQVLPEGLQVREVSGQFESILDGFNV